VESESSSSALVTTMGANQLATTIPVNTTITSSDLQMICAAMTHSLVVALQQPPNLRRERDEFEMMADDAFYEKLIAVACYVDSLHYYRIGSDRFQIFTYDHVKQSLERALSHLTDTDGKQASKEFFLDQWYFDTLPDSIKFAPPPDKGSIGGDIGSLSRRHCADWVGELTKSERRWPGLTLALHSALKQQTRTEEQMREQFKIAMDYMRTQNDEPVARLGKDILKARKAPGSSGSRDGGRVLGGGY
jgi:hypothetical protein